VTVSIGVASAPGEGDGEPGGAGWRTLFDTADLNLFSAKRGGRNRVRAQGSSPGDTERPEQVEQ